MESQLYDLLEEHRAFESSVLVSLGAPSIAVGGVRRHYRC